MDDALRTPSDYEAWRSVESAQHVSVAGSIVGRFELARLVNRPGDVLKVTRLYQSLSVLGSGPGAPQANEVRDPAWPLNNAGNVAVSWNLAFHKIDAPNGKLSQAFPFAAPTLAATAVALTAAQPPGWVNAPLKYLWGNETPQRLIVTGHTAVRLYCDVTDNGNILRSVSGLLRGEARAFEDTPDFWAWFHSRS